MSAAPRRAARFAALATALALASSELAGAQERSTPPEPPAAPPPAASASASSDVDAAYDVPGFVALTARAEVEGDDVALVRALLAEARSDPSSFSAFLALLRLADLEGSHTAALLAERAAVDALVEAIGASAAAPEAPLWAAQARERAFWLARSLASRRGEREEVVRLSARLGVLDRWSAVGPFGLGGVTGAHQRAFGPERALLDPGLSAATRFAGRYGPEGLRSLAAGLAEANLAPGRRGRMAEGAVYLLCQVRGEAGRRVRLRIASGSSFKAWWGQAELANVDRASAHHPAEVEGVVELGEGWQRLWVKLASGSDALWITASAPAGEARPLALELAEVGRFEAPGAPGPVIAPVSAARPEGDALARAAEARAAAQGLPPGLALAAAALYADALGERPRALALFERALASGADRYPGVLVRAAGALEGAGHLARAERESRARPLYERALAIDPAHLAASVRKARYLDEEGAPARAFRALEALSEAHPGAALPREQALALADREGWEAEERALIEELGALARDGQAVVRLAWLRQQDGDLAGWRAALERAQTLERAGGFVEARLAQIDAITGAIDAARARLDGIEAWRPDEPGSARARADLEAAIGDTDESLRWRLEAVRRSDGAVSDLEAAAHFALAEARRRPPDDPRGVELLAEARALIEGALAREPGRFELRRLLARLGGEPDLPAAVADLVISAEEVLASAPDRSVFPRAHAVCLLDHSIAWLQPDGSVTEIVHQIFEIRDAEGVRKHHSISVPGEVLALRTYATDGQIYEPLRAGNETEALMPKLEPGARFEVRFRIVRPRPPSPQLELGPFYFRDPNFQEPFVLSRWDVVAPRELALEVWEQNLAAPRESKERDGLVHMRWEARMVEVGEPEAFMPSAEEILPHVTVLTRLDLADLAEHRVEWLAGRSRVTPEIRAQAEAIAVELAAAQAAASSDGDSDSDSDSQAAGAAREGVDASALADAIARFVDAHVVRPRGGYEASQVLAERGGDRLVLLRALLDAAGIPVELGFAGPNPRLAPPERTDPPHTDLFQTPVLRVAPEGGEPRWFAQGPRKGPPWLVPMQLAGASVLIVGPGAPRVDRLPDVPLAAVREERSLTVALTGVKARARHATTVHGAGGHGAKEQFETVPRQQVGQWLEGQAARLFRRPRLVGFDIDGIDREDAPLTFAYEVEVEGHVEVPGEGRGWLKSGLSALDLSRQLGGRPTRKMPFVLRAAADQRDRVEVTLGDAWSVESLPEDHHARLPFGIYSLTFELLDGGRKVVITRRFTNEGAHVAAIDYPRMLGQAMAIDRAEAQRIALRRR